MTIDVRCPHCDQWHKVELDIREWRPRELTEEDRQARRERALANLDAGMLGRPKGAKDNGPRKERSDKGRKRGPMSRGAEL